MQVLDFEVGHQKSKYPAGKETLGEDHDPPHKRVCIDRVRDFRLLQGFCYILDMTPVCRFYHSSICMPFVEQYQLQNLN